jgi:hypothetical protein
MSQPIQSEKSPLLNNSSQGSQFPQSSSSSSTPCDQQASSRSDSIYDSSLLAAAFIMISALVLESVSQLDPVVSAPTVIRSDGTFASSSSSSSPPELPTSLRVTCLVLVSMLASPPFDSKYLFSQRMLLAFVLIVVALFSDFYAGQDVRFLEGLYIQIVGLFAVVFFEKNSSFADAKAKRENSISLVAGLLILIGVRCFSHSIYAAERALNLRIEGIRPEAVVDGVSVALVSASAVLVASCGILVVLNHDEIYLEGMEALSKIFSNLSTMLFFLLLAAQISHFQLVDGMLSFGPGACASATSACTLAFKTRRFHVSNLQITPLWASFIALTFLSAPKSLRCRQQRRPRQKGHDEPQPQLPCNDKRNDATADEDDDDDYDDGHYYYYHHDYFKSSKDRERSLLRMQKWLFVFGIGALFLLFYYLDRQTTLLDNVMLSVLSIGLVWVKLELFGIALHLYTLLAFFFEDPLDLKFFTNWCLMSTTALLSAILISILVLALLKVVVASATVLLATCCCCPSPPNDEHDSYSDYRNDNPKGATVTNAITIAAVPTTTATSTSTTTTTTILDRVIALLQRLTSLSLLSLTSIQIFLTISALSLFSAYDGSLVMHHGDDDGHTANTNNDNGNSANDAGDWTHFDWTISSLISHQLSYVFVSSLITSPWFVKSHHQFSNTTLRLVFGLSPLLVACVYGIYIAATRTSFAYAQTDLKSLFLCATSSIFPWLVILTSVC